MYFEHSETFIVVVLVGKMVKFRVIIESKFLAFGIVSLNEPELVYVFPFIGQIYCLQVLIYCVEYFFRQFAFGSMRMMVCALVCLFCVQMFSCKT